MGLTKTRERGIAVLRVLMGWVFFYAGLEKLLGVGLDAGKTWTAGGFLKFATLGALPGSADGAVINPTHDFWAGLAADPNTLNIINLMVPWGELLIGLALIFGLATRFAALMGVIMLGMFYIASWDFSLGVLNEDLVYLVVTAFLGIAAAGELYGLDKYVDKTPLVATRAPALRYVLG